MVLNGSGFGFLTVRVRVAGTDVQLQMSMLTSMMRRVLQKMRPEWSRVHARACKVSMTAFSSCLSPCRLGP
jgi:hypothetical protein